MMITDRDIREFRRRAKTELKSGWDCGRLRWDDVVEALCDEVERLGDTRGHRRNCDRFNTGDPLKDAEDAYGAWQSYCDDPTIPQSSKVESAFRQWILATAKPEAKGEDDGSK